MRLRSKGMGVLLLAMAMAIAFAPAALAVEADGAREAFARMDSDRDGQLSLDEFEKGIRRPFGAHRDGVVYQKLPARFRALDADGSSYLEAAEYARLVEGWHLGGEPPAFGVADQGGDGRVDFREFAAMHAPREEIEVEAPDTLGDAAATR